MAVIDHWHSIGLSIVVTGVPPIGRKNADKLVQVYGGKLVKAIAKKTSFVVLGNDAGPKKLDQINEFGLKTYTDTEFVKLIEDGTVSLVLSSWKTYAESWLVGLGAGGIKRSASEDDEDEEEEKPTKKPAKKQKKWFPSSALRRGFCMCSQHA